MLHHYSLVKRVGINVEIETRLQKYYAKNGCVGLKTQILHPLYELQYNISISIYRVIKEDTQVNLDKYKDQPSNPLTRNML
uniref:Uncharacterized protein n=1 Tax=Arion vulgaris TaxID=1028688 RepID=A0A0B7BSH0_9EUPU